MKLTAAILALTAIASVASADAVTLTAPLAGATLQEAGVDMSVYMDDTDAGLQVVATYTPTGLNAPARLSMVLADGEAVSFGLPGAPTAYYSFARVGQSVTVTAQPVAVRVASN